tara:strand:+ start:298 stop:1188 length:891 start_codon:yes stop_codon:yes gene_type:complete
MTNEDVESKTKIFFVDDDQELLELVSVKLGKEFEVHTFSDPLDCVEASEKHLPKLIIVDLNMPNIDGYEVLKQLRGHPATASIPIVCTSASTKQADRNRAEKLGAIGFLAKPYNLKSLNKDIRAILDNLNKVVKALTGNSLSMICFNEAEKRRLILEDIKSQAEGGETIVVLSWDKGEDFLDEKLIEFVKDNRIFYLEMGPSLITKLPYLEDVSPIFEDIENLSSGLDLSQANLILDDPQNLFGHDSRQRSLATTITLAKIIKATFRKSHVYMARSSDPELKNFTMRMASIFTGRS